MSVPVRTCVGCRQRSAQAALTRFVRAPDGWQPDPPGAEAATGARGLPLFAGVRAAGGKEQAVPGSCICGGRIWFNK